MKKSSTGVYVTPLNRLREYIEGADAAGLSVAVHAIGDRANAELLDIFAEVAKKNGPRIDAFASSTPSICGPAIMDVSRS